MYKIAVMGDKESIIGFSTLGLSVFPTENPDDAVSLLKKLQNGGFGIIYITEKLAAEIPETIEKYKKLSFPVVIKIPGITGNDGSGITDLHKCVEKAVGSDILENMK